ncbi:E1-E2 ATPase, putative, partial [Hepatocystis sp. ex Piliocolobus tephrosceles]
DIDKFKEKTEDVEKKEHGDVICFACKEVILSEDDKNILEISNNNFNSDYNTINYNMDVSFDYNYDDVFEESEIKRKKIKKKKKLYAKYLEQNDFTCISVLVFNKTLSKHFYFDYRLLEANDVCVKFFTHYNLLKTTELLNSYMFFFTKNLKISDAKKLGIMNMSNYNCDYDNTSLGNKSMLLSERRINTNASHYMTGSDTTVINADCKENINKECNEYSDRYGNTNEQKIDNKENNVNGVIKNNKSNINQTNMLNNMSPIKDSNEMSYAGYNNLYHYKLKDNTTINITRMNNSSDDNQNKYLEQNMKSEIANLNTLNNDYDSRCFRMKNMKDIQNKDHGNMIYKNDIFYNCTNQDLMYIMHYYIRHGNFALVTNNSNLICDSYYNNLLSLITVCDEKSKDESKDKSDIVLLNKSLFNFMKIKYISNRLFMNILLFIEYNITMYTCLIILSIITCIVHGFEFLNTMQILYIYANKNIILYYISCFRKSDFCIGENRNKKNVKDIFKDININKVISGICSKTLILVFVFLFGHLFIPESKWNFVSDDIRNQLDFSEFSFYKKDKSNLFFYHTIRSSIRFKKNIEQLKIIDKFNIRGDYRTVREWETFLSPSRHSTIMFNVFFLLFFFYFIYLYIKSFLKEINIYNEKIHRKNNNKCKEIYSMKTKHLSKNINNVLKELKKSRQIMSTYDKVDKNEVKGELSPNDMSTYPTDTMQNIVLEQGSSYQLCPKCNEYNIFLSSDISYNQTPKNTQDEQIKPSATEFLDQTIGSTAKNKREMLFQCVKKNYLTFLIFLAILIVHIGVIEFGSVLFSCHVRGLTIYQWLFCFGFCIIDFVLYFILSRMNLFGVSFSFKSMKPAHTPHRMSMFETIYEYKRSSVSQKFKYNLEKTRKSWH